jgi:hypothetical protein
MKRNLFQIILFIFLSFGYLNSRSQDYLERFQFDPDLSYRDDIPSPSSFLGYELGDEVTFYHETLSYYEKLEASSDRLVMDKNGMTYERRPLVHIIITSPANQANLESIRKRHLEISDPLKYKFSETVTIGEEDPVILLLGYNIHGDEASSMETSMQVAYRLCAAKDEETEELLEKSIIILIPCFNPDGRDRFAFTYRSYQQQQIVSDRNDMEHQDHWPSARTNHYWFDLNRDFMWNVHPETKSASSIMQQWMPQLIVDYHEMGPDANYFTGPAIEPQNPLIGSDRFPLVDSLTNAATQALDRYHIRYATREIFDQFYPSYTNSYAELIGSVSILCEQGTTQGRAIRTKDDFVRYYRQSIFDHYITSMAFIKKAVEMREALLSYTAGFLNPQKIKNKIYILPDEPNGYLYDVLNMLMHHGVIIQRTKEKSQFNNLRDYDREDIFSKSFNKGTFIIDSRQSRHFLIETLFAKSLELKDTITYDITSWSIPHAYNLEVYFSEFPQKYEVEKVEDVLRVPSGIKNQGLNYAYLIDWKQRNAPRALSLLWDKEYRVRFAKRPFEIEGKGYSSGTVILLTGRNLDKESRIIKDLESIAGQAQVEIIGVGSSRTDKGPDLGSLQYMTPVKKPDVGMLVNGTIHPYSAGELWYLFDQETEFAVSRLNSHHFEFWEYDVLIIPASTQPLDNVFTDEKLNSLKLWIQEGGILVVLGNSVDYFTRENSKLTDVELVKIPEDSSENALYLKYADREKYTAQKSIPGAALLTHVDKSNPVAFGLGDKVIMLKMDQKSLKPMAKMETVAYYEKDSAKLLLSGYASNENLGRLSGKIAVGVVPVNKGKVVFIMDNTQFRMFWRGPSRMVQNAVMLLSERD